jgi:hypothetical protein
MNTACTCKDDELRTEGMSALCPVCTREYDAWLLARHAEQEAASYWLQAVPA